MKLISILQNRKRKHLLSISMLFPVFLLSQTLTNIENYMKINASGNDPLYTTYAPSLLRSDVRFPIFFKLDYSIDSCPVQYSSSIGTKVFSFWKSGEENICKIADYFSKPVITYSFPDLMIMEYEPFNGIQVRETFLVYSFDLAIVEMEVRNTNSGPFEIELFSILDLEEDSAEAFIIKEPEMISVLNKKFPPGTVPAQYQSNRNSDPIKLFFSASPKVSDHVFFQGSRQELRKYLISGDQKKILTDIKDSSSKRFSHSVFRQYKYLRPKESIQFRYMIGVQTSINREEAIIKELKFLKNCFFRTFFEDDLMLFLNIPQILFSDPNEKLLYISSLNLARGAMLPSGYGFNFNTYKNSTNINSDHDISLRSFDYASGLTGYVFFDAKSAENVFRYFMTKENIVEFRSMEEKEYHGMVESPLLYNWIAYEIFTRSRNKDFLNDVYQSGVGRKEIMNYTEVASSKQGVCRGFFLHKEAESLSKMAKELGKETESQGWQNQAKKISENLSTKTEKDLSNEISDDSTGGCHDGYEKDLIRGILSLWTGTASIDQAKNISALFADSGNVVIPGFMNYILCMPDRNKSTQQYFSACMTENPLWLYIVYEGVKKYGYHQITHQVASQIFKCYFNRLSMTHDFPAGCCPQTDSGNEMINGFVNSILVKLLYENSVE